MKEIMTGQILLNNDNGTFLLCDDVKRGKLSFYDDDFQSCIGVNNMRGSIELLRLCAKELTESKTEYKIVNSFINRLEELSNKSFERSHARNSIEVVDDE
jgi:hypothetical protein